MYILLIQWNEYALLSKLERLAISVFLGRGGYNSLVIGYFGYVEGGDCM